MDRAAWDFAELNASYARHQQMLAQRPRHPIENEATAKAFFRWLQQESAAWMDVLGRDPLLPEALLPADYAGRQSWRQRRIVMAEAAEQMRGFKLG